MTRASFLKAIYQSPEDRAVRAIYADWLQEQDDPQGELIALQLARARDSPSTPRERELIEQHGMTWVAPIARLIAGDLWFEDGFLTGCCCRRRPPTPEQLEHPIWTTLRSLELHPKPALLPPSPLLRSTAMRALESVYGLALDDLEAAYKHPQAQNWTTLGMAWLTNLEQLERVLERLGELPNVHTLDLYDSAYLRLEELSFLLDAPAVEQLQELRLTLRYPRWDSIASILESAPSTLRFIVFCIYGMYWIFDRKQIPWSLTVDLRTDSSVYVLRDFERWLPTIAQTQLTPELRVLVQPYTSKHALGRVQEAAKQEGLMTSFTIRPTS